MEVRLYEGQELKLIDDHHAVVIFEDGTTASTITAESARDADGTGVPTTVDVSAANVVTLTVHHRAGDPAASGTDFDYPVTVGPAFEVGYSTVTVLMPPNEPEREPEVAVPATSCVVPGLLGRKLKENRVRLRNAGCKLGRVRGERWGGARVVKQSRAAGTVLAAGARVAVKLG